VTGPDCEPRDRPIGEAVTFQSNGLTMAGAFSLEGQRPAPPRWSFRVPGRWAAASINAPRQISASLLCPYELRVARAERAALGLDEIASA
jgi:hypothetical protein